MDSARTDRLLGRLLRRSRAFCGHHCRTGFRAAILGCALARLVERLGSSRGAQAELVAGGLRDSGENGVILIVKADDFGMSAGVNRGIIQGHQAGVITSTSLMVR